MNRFRVFASDVVFWVLCTPFWFVAFCFAALSDLVRGRER